MSLVVRVLPEPQSPALCALDFASDPSLLVRGVQLVVASGSAPGAAAVELHRADGSVIAPIASDRSPAATVGCGW
ncbi:MAG TPA: hypothetical protein VF761_07970 [Gemmatimonadaceae bacterium]